MKTVSQIPWAYGVDAFFNGRIPHKLIRLKSRNDIKGVLGSRDKLCIRGAGTGYAGGAVPLADETVVSTRALDGMEKIDLRDKTIWCEPGVTLGKIKEFVRRYALYYPPDPASFKVCTIGGAASTNAGGPNCFSYGVTSNHVVSLKFEIKKGSAQTLDIGLDSRSALTYDLRDILIGSSGTFGIISRVKLRLRNAPPAVRDYFIFFKDYKKAVSFMQNTLEHGLVPSAMDMSLEPYIPGKSKTRAAILMTTIEGGSYYVSAAHNVMMRSIHRFAQRHVVSKHGLMEFRTRLVNSHVRKTVKKSGKSCYFLFDAVVPRKDLTAILTYSYELADKLKLPIKDTFHAGDGNIHPAVFYNPDDPRDLEKVEAFWYAILKAIQRYNGSISGEHGIGVEKRDFFSFHEDPRLLRFHGAVKDFFDPSEKFGLGKLFSGCRNGSAMDRYKKLMRKYGIDKIVYKPSKKFQKEVISVDPGLSIAEINKRIEREQVMVRYVPIAFSSKPIAFHIKHNIPSLLSHNSSLPDLVVGGEIATQGKKWLHVGRKVLKNVSGYSTKILLHHPEIVRGNIHRIYLKAHPIEKIAPTEAFVNIEPETLTAAKRLINTFRRHAINYILRKTAKGINLTFIVFNDRRILSLMERELDTRKLTYHISFQMEFEPIDSDSITIVSYTSDVTPQFNEFTYVSEDKVCIAPSHTRITGFTGIDSIRRVDDSGSHYVYLSRKAEAQERITQALVRFLIRARDRDKRLKVVERLAPLRALTRRDIPRPVFSQIKKCAQCGLCLSACPQFLESYDEERSPRGIIAQLKLGQLGTKGRRFVEKCAEVCGKKRPCETTCVTGVRFSELIRFYKRGRRG